MMEDLLDRALANAEKRKWKEKEESIKSESTLKQ